MNEECQRKLADVDAILADFSKSPIANNIIDAQEILNRNVKIIETIEALKRSELPESAESIATLACLVQELNSNLSRIARVYQELDSFSVPTVA